MLQLAYNLNGEPFEAPTTMAAWRVRKVKKAGAPEIIYGLDGLPLFVPMDADIEDLRHHSGGETGKFRLDPVDEHNRSIPNAPASYVCVHSLPPAPAPTAPAPATPAASASAETTTQLITALLESQKQHTEMARMYVSQFAVVANAMAGVVRSAGDAGLTARVPLVLPAAPEAKPAETCDQERETDDDEIDESEIDAEEAVEAAPQTEEYSWARVGQAFVDHVGPYVGPMMASSPGLAKLLGATGGRPKTDATPPGSGPSGPAPARGDASPPRGPVPGVDAAMLVRLQQIMAQLTPDEEQFARSLIDEIPAEDMASWIDRLRAMSISEAAAYVRAMFGQARAAAGEAQPARRGSPTAPTAPTAHRRTGHPARGSSEATPVRGQTSETSPTRQPVPKMETNDDATLRDAGTQAHLDRIERALSADERTAMRKHFAALSPSERSLFVATLLMLPVADAAAVVRGKVGAHPATRAPMSPASDDAAPGPVAVDLVEASPNPTVSAPARMRTRTTAPTTAPHDATPLAPAEPRTPANDAAPDAIAGSTAAGSAADDAPATVERNAHTHLAEIESTLAPEERLVVHTLISGLSPDARDAWLERLLSASVEDGAGMLRAAIQAATAEPPNGKARTSSARRESATASAHRAAATSKEVATGRESDGDGGDGLSDDDELGGDDDLGGRDARDDHHELDDDNDPDHGDQPVAPDRPDISAASPSRLDAPPPHPAIATDAELPTFDADSLAHFQAVADTLTLAEKMRANELAAQRPAGELRRWYADLVQLSVPDAVAKIRAELARSDSDSQSTKKGGVS